MTTEPTRTLYRFFAADGQLLYVGRTIDARSRFRSHERSKEWFDEVARIDRQIFLTSESLAEAEIQAIRGEEPLHNIQHSTRASAKPRPRLRLATDLEIEDERIARRRAKVDEMWGEVPASPCPRPEPASGCECEACVEELITELDNARLEHADDLVLVEKLDELETEYLAGADVIDWIYDFDDLMMFRRWRLQAHSMKKPAPALAEISNGLIRVSCPFCMDIHEHYVVTGSPVGVLDCACLGDGRYLPVFDFHDANESSLKWIRSVA